MVMGRQSDGKTIKGVNIMKLSGEALRKVWYGLGAAVALAASVASAGQQPATASGNGGPPLFDNLGNLHHPISTSMPKAQQYFDQGLRLVFAFNHEEAINSFEEAARLDPKAAMAYWGIALALGPNINLPMDRESEKRAYEAIQRAHTLAAGVSSEGTGLYRGARYPLFHRARCETRDVDAAYADAMKKVWADHPKDADAGASMPKR